MKRLIYILVVVSLVVAVSGCTGDIWATNKSYSGSGITFTYPGAWNEGDQNTLNYYALPDSNLTTVIGNSDYTFGVWTLNYPQLTTEQNQQVLQGLKSNMSSVQGATKLSDKDITVDGTQGVQIDYKSNDPNAADLYVSVVAWIKNGKAYIVAFGSKTNDTQTLDRIINSMKVT